MKELIKTLKLRFNPKKVPGKAPRVGDVGWMVDCKGTLFLKKVHLGHYLATIPFPVGLVGGGVSLHGGKIF